MPSPSPLPAPPSRGALLLAFATLYVVWGSTYLAIRIAVASWPPLFMAAVRFALAGGALYLFLRARGVPAPDRRAWGATSLVGGLLLGVGNGAVCWAEQWVPSGIAALIVAATPLWMTILPWVVRRAPAPRPVSLAGVLLGMTGVAVLLWGTGAHLAGSTSGPAWAPVLVLVACFSWAVGSLWSRRLPMPASPFLSTAMQMLAACPLLLAASLVRGELSSLSAAIWAPAAVGSVVYLILFGSIAGFGSYVWLLRHTTPTLASTYAFVNPLVAVVLGWALAGERIGAATFAATVIIVVSVAAVVMGSGQRSTPRS